jgi:hypothetical protein
MAASKRGVPDRIYLMSLFANEMTAYPRCSPPKDLGLCKKPPARPLAAYAAK